MIDPLNLSYKRQEPGRSTLVVGWNSDTGRLGEGVTGYLIKKLNGQLFYEIEPTDFFPLGSVTIEDDMVQFPESKFYICPDYNLVVFISSPPVFELFSFFQKVLDVAEKYCNVKEVYSVGGMASLDLHTCPRQLLGSFSTRKVKESQAEYDIDGDLNYETPHGQKPMLNSFLLWAARRRKLAGIDLSIPIPFYYISLDDYKAQKRVLEFLDQRFNLGFDFWEFDENIKRQNQYLNNIRDNYPEIDDYFIRLESNLHLSEEENMKLIKIVEENLKVKRISNL
jgi:proteasome assembly chaperone (PAC2) family protein